MNREDFIKNLEETYARGIELVKRKNQDYAGHGDPFRNFRSSSIIGISVEKNIMLQIVNKISRIGNILGKDNAVKDEAVEDSILDLINYAAILNAYLDSEKMEITDI